jgi:2-polyprenyl-3-methyl-5-hydroxy-6-metoxy-1,4-benzoquinol methylase
VTTADPALTRRLLNATCPYTGLTTSELLEHVDGVARVVTNAQQGIRPDPALAKPRRRRLRRSPR